MNQFGKVVRNLVAKVQNLNYRSTSPSTQNLRSGILSGFLTLNVHPIWGGLPQARNTNPTNPWFPVLLGDPVPGFPPSWCLFWLSLFPCLACLKTLLPGKFIFWIISNMLANMLALACICEYNVSNTHWVGCHLPTGHQHWSHLIVQWRSELKKCVPWSEIAGWKFSLKCVNRDKAQNMPKHSYFQQCSLSAKISVKIQNKTLNSKCSQNKD